MYDAKILILDLSTFPVIEKRKNDINELPIQSILLGESIVWTRFMEVTLENKRNEDFKYFL